MSGILLSALPPLDRYKLLTAVVIPRPIALVTTIDTNGAVNAAPYSFFNIFSEDPPLVALGLQHKEDLSPKDTARNIRREGEFVINLVDEALATAMNECAIDFPTGDSEVEAAALATLPSVNVRVPRLAAAPFALECRRHTALALTQQRELLIGEVLRVHARDGLLDEGRMHVNLDAYHPIGRMFGDLYTTTRKIFSLKRESHAQWTTRVKDKRALQSP